MSFGVARARAALNDKGTKVFRAKTIPGLRLSRAEHQAADLTVYPDDVQRPVTRGDCENGPRPCPFVSCAHHLYLDVNASGTLKLNFPQLEVEEMAESCSLDVADRGGITLEEVGATMNLTRERIRQYEVEASRKIRLVGGEALGISK